jgi:hypothetical protein
MTFSQNVLPLRYTVPEESSTLRELDTFASLSMTNYPYVRILGCRVRLGRTKYFPEVKYAY